MIVLSTVVFIGIQLVPSKHDTKQKFQNGSLSNHMEYIYIFIIQRYELHITSSEDGTQRNIIYIIYAIYW